MAVGVADAARSDWQSIARTWGTTAAEREQPLPCDRWLDHPDETLFRAVDVEAPASVLFRWLCQLRVAPYSYDWLDNFGRRSPRRLTPGLEALAVGQRVMTFFEIVDFERDRHLTARTTSTASLLGEFAASYVVVPRGDLGSRVLVKLLVSYPPGPIGWALRWLLPWGDLIMMRRQLLTLKALAEESVRLASRGEHAP